MLFQIIIFVFWQYWGLSSGSYTCWGVRPHLRHCYFAFVILDKVSQILPAVALDRSPPTHASQ
jgi:hypothetical protein